MELHELHEHVKPAPKKNKRPVGVLVLVVWFAISILMSLTSFFKPMLLIGTVLITGAPVIFFTISMMAVLAYIIYGLLTKKKWVVYAVIAYEMFGVMIMFLSVVSYFSDRDRYMELLNQISGVSTDIIGQGFYDILNIIIFAFTSFISAIIIFYMLRRNSYFTE